MRTLRSSVLLLSVLACRDPGYDTATTPEPVVLSAGAVADAFGLALGAAGDINGDGNADVVIGAPQAAAYAGTAYVFLGTAAGPADTPAATLAEGAPNDYFGASVAGAGDVNGDGYDDLVLGAYGPDPFTGSATVFLGSAAGLESTPNRRYLGDTVDDTFGLPVAAAGDVNGDGYDDVLIGAPGAGGSAGRATLYLGSATGLPESADWAVDGAASSALGIALAGAGDVNGDGYDDVIIGAYGADSYTGEAWVFLGSASGLSTTADTVLVGDGDALYYGGSVVGDCDVNGDGYDDVLVAAVGDPRALGYVYLYAGSPTGVAAPPAAIRMGEANSSLFGLTMACAGDTDADGYDDVIIGAVGYGASMGRAYLYRGSSAGLAESATSLFDGAAPGDHYANRVCGAGDTNHDGYADWMISDLVNGQVEVHFGAGVANQDTAAEDTAAEDTAADTAQDSGDQDSGDGMGALDDSDATPVGASGSDKGTCGCATRGGSGRNGAALAALLLVVAARRTRP